MEKVNDRIPSLSVPGIIAKRGKNPEGPVGSKVFAVMYHICKGKEDNGGSGQDQDHEQEVPVPNYHFFHIYSLAGSKLIRNGYDSDAGIIILVITIPVLDGNASCHKNTQM